MIEAWRYQLRGLKVIGLTKAEVKEIVVWFGDLFNMKMPLAGYPTRS